MTTVNNIANAVLKAQKSSSTSAYDTSATVTRVTDDEVFVHIDGGVPETPCQKTIDCKAGDVVKIRISGGKAWITGNATAPPTDDTKATAAHAAADVAYEAAEVADQKAVTAGRTATDAKIIAEAVNQFFWHDTNGAHVTEIPQEDWLPNPSGNNILMNALGVLIRSGLIASASFSAGAVTFYAPDGATEIARFAADGVTLGDRNNAHQYVDYKSMELVDREGDAYFGVYDMRGADGFATITDYFVGDGVTTCFTISISSSEVMDVTINTVQVAATDYIKTHDSVTFNQPPATEDLIAIVYKTNSSGVNYYTLGKRRSNSTNGAMSVASGAYVEASGLCSHAEGSGTIARGNFSHAEGEGTTAGGDGSHAGGFYTEANEDNQTVIGKFNDSTIQNKVFVVGNGVSDNARSNAFSVSWDGDIEADRDVVAGRNISVAGTVNIADSIKRKTYTWTISSIAANEYKSTEVNPPAESGYTPIGIIGYGISGTGTASAQWIKCHIRPSDNKLVIGIKNDTTTAGTDWEVTVYILYAKS